MIQFLTITLGIILTLALFLVLGLVIICVPVWCDDRRERQIEAAYKARGFRE